MVHPPLASGGLRTGSPKTGLPVLGVPGPGGAWSRWNTAGPPSELVRGGPEAVSQAKGRRVSTFRVLSSNILLAQNGLHSPGSPAPHREECCVVHTDPRGLALNRVERHVKE